MDDQPAQDSKWTSEREATAHFMACTELEAALSHASGLVNRLTAKLERVLQPSGTQMLHDNVAVQLTPSWSDLTAYLRARIEEAQSVNARLEALAERIDL